jgi:hypothetical protein
MMRRYFRRRRRVSSAFAWIAVALSLATGWLVGELSPLSTPTFAQISLGGGINAGLTLLFNAILAATTVRLYRVGRYQAILFRRQNRIMQSQTALMNGQLVATRDSVVLTRESLLLTHRPKIIFRNVDISVRVGVDSVEDGQIWATNTGNSRATLIRFEAQWLAEDRLPNKNPYARRQPTTPCAIRLPPGQTRPIDLPTLYFGDMAAHKAVWDDPAARGPSLFLVGIAKYIDDAGTLRGTAFCRRYDRATQRFHAVDDPDYEYAD